MVSDRGLDVLRAIVQDYVESREPVGSKSLVERYSFGVSAATIRNDMAQLEEEGLITAPHTSSGRVPTDKGYRTFVDRLADVRPLTSAQRQAIETFLNQATDLDEVLARTVRLLSQLTHQVALVQYPALGRARIRHVELVPLSEHRIMSVLITDTGRVDQKVVELADGFDLDYLSDLRARINAVLDGVHTSDAAERLTSLVEGAAPERQPVAAKVVASLTEQLIAHRGERLVMAGTPNLALTADDFGGSIVPILEAVEEQVTLLRLFAEMEPDESGLSTRIGSEIEEFGLGGTSVLASEYVSSGETASLGVIGPTRMDYSTNMAAVRAVARYLSRLLGED